MHNNEKDAAEKLFNYFKEQWDTEEPTDGHRMRFMEKLDKGKKKKRWAPLWLAVPIAAAVLLVLGLYITYIPKVEDKNITLSQKTMETQNYFATIIEKEIAKVEKESTPETKIIVQDALQKMRAMEEDYDKLTKELSEKGENKKIIHAMITNLQIRISFLEEVLVKIENIKKIKQNYHEDNQA